MQLVGRQFLSVDAGDLSKLLFNHTAVVWSKANSTACTSCPSVLPFQVQFPNVYKDGKETHPLPPTFTIDSARVPGVSIRCEYILTVIVTKSRFGGLKKQKEYVVTFLHCGV